MWDNNGEYDKLESEDNVIYYSDEDDDDEFQFQSEDQNKRSNIDEVDGKENLDHERWATGMLKYFINKWKQKNIGSPPSNWKDILIKLLDLEQYQGVNATEDFDRFSEDFNGKNEDYEELKAKPQATRTGWFPNVQMIGLKGGHGNVRQQQDHHLKLSNNKNEATKNICFTNSVLQLLRRTAYVLMLLNQFPHFLIGKSTTIV